jgi:hypothetical protein
MEKCQVEAIRGYDVAVQGCGMPAGCDESQYQGDVLAAPGSLDTGREAAQQQGGTGKVEDHTQGGEQYVHTISMSVFDNANIRICVLAVEVPARARHRMIDRVACAVTASMPAWTTIILLVAALGYL